MVKRSVTLFVVFLLLPLLYTFLLFVYVYPQSTKYVLTQNVGNTNGRGSKKKRKKKHEKEEKKEADPDQVTREKENIGGLQDRKRLTKPWYTAQYCPNLQIKE